MPISEATNALYAAFASVPRGSVDGCSCCVTAEDQAVLARVPRQQLTAAQLDTYAFKAMTTWGDADSYRYFAPRIVELALSPDGADWPGFDAGLVMRKLVDAGLSGWSSGERDALAGFAEAAWCAALAVDPDLIALPASALLPLVLLLCDDTRALTMWEQDRSTTSLLQLAEMIKASFDDLMQRGRLHGPWEALAVHDEVVRWLSAQARGAALEEAALSDGMPTEVAARLANAADAWSFLSATARAGAAPCQ